VNLTLSMAARPDGLATATSSERKARFERNQWSISFSMVKLLGFRPIPGPVQAAHRGAALPGTSRHRMRFRLGATLLVNLGMRLFLSGQGRHSRAIGVAGVALPWLLLSEGHSVGLARLVYQVTLVPFVVLRLPAGALGDRLAWRRVMYASHATQA